MVENKTNYYSVSFTKVRVFEFTDAEMRDFGYEGYITDEMREEYLNNLITDFLNDEDYDTGYDDIEVEKMKD